MLLGLVSRDGQPQLVLRRPIPPDTWLHDSELLVPSGQDLPVADIEKELSSRADSIYRELEETGWISPRRYYRLGRAAGTTPGASFADFRTRLAGRFTSVPGRKFKRIYDRCDDRSCNLAMLKRAARLYYRESDRYLQTDLEEYLLVGTLTGVRADHERTPEQDLVFDNCGSADYFEGHGLRALTTKSPEDYLSAYDSASTEVCFTLNPDKVRSLRRLMLVWHSKERVPKGLSLTGFEDPNGVWSKGYHSELRDPPGFATGQLFSSYIDITQETRFGRYRLAVTEEDDSGGLLVLRAIVPIFGKSDGARRDPLFSLVQEVNASMPYGEGVGRLPPEVPVSVESAVRYLLSAESAHCGNYSFVFASRLQPNTSWTIFGLQSFDGRAHHAVVEVQDGQSLRTFDPTLGVVYNCGIEPLIDGSCDYDDYLSGNLHPAFNRYFGVRLLYGARILSVYESLADFL